MSRMLSRLRLIVTWLLLAALPWHGVVAASMVMCQPQTQAVSAAPDSQPLVSAHAGHDGHDGHSHVHAQSSEDHAAVYPVSLDDAEGHGLQPDAGHHCAACSMCGHALALAVTVIAFDSPPAPQDLVPGVPLRLASRVAPIPDKPPRA